MFSSQQSNFFEQLTFLEIHSTIHFRKMLTIFEYFFQYPNSWGGGDTKIIYSTDWTIPSVKHRVHHLVNPSENIKYHFSRGTHFLINLHTKFFPSSTYFISKINLFCVENYVSEKLFTIFFLLIESILFLCFKGEQLI